ncbi:hypothetical protein Q3G72_016473 [Acer saccharum]|nr:hypothetical protein Q3G72_016473 [Acer saccharum]
MFARLKLVPTPAEMAKRFFKGIYDKGNLYDVDAERHMTVEPSDTEGSYSRPNDTEYPHSGLSDTEGSSLEGGGRSPVRHRRVRFVLPTQPRPRGDSRPGVEGHSEDRRYTELVDAFRQLRDERHGVTPREEVTGGTGDTETAHIEIEQVPHQVLPDHDVHPQDLGQSASIPRTPLVDPSAVHPSIHSTGTEFLSPGAPIGFIPVGLTPAGNPREQSSSIQCTRDAVTRGPSSSI